MPIVWHVVSFQKDLQIPYCYQTSSIGTRVFWPKKAKSNENHTRKFFREQKPVQKFCKYYVLCTETTSKETNLDNKYKVGTIRIFLFLEILKGL